MSLQVKCKTLPNGKIAGKHKAGGISRKSSTEEKERGREKEREKEESHDKEENEEEDDVSEENRAEEQAFLVELYKYMKDRDTPIERIPFLGFKQSE